MTPATTAAMPDPFERVLPAVHEAVRRSQLLVALYEKLEALPVGAFPFASEFGGLQKVVVPQIGDTRILFREFTPHDEPLHVVKLFQLADKLFGPHVYQQLNAAELFLLACALYAHDWGMAVGEAEKVYLLNGAPLGAVSGSFTPLTDELERLSAFLRREGQASENESGSLHQMDLPHLRLYVRETHARRSGARVRAHFHEYPAVGEAVAQLCEGHWHDFATLDDPDRFPRDYEVAGQTVNLLALTLYVRLIDLFHITDDRTPYALWLFVSPKDQRSSEEWKKHRALHGVSVIDYAPGRAIRIQGFTEDEEVWAGLQDLRQYCDEQVRQALHISARHIPERYGLNFLKVDWAVTTGSLRPVDFRFEFDRLAMFRILSEDIYDGDPYVFLRELLQNSIDAIRTRRARNRSRFQGSGKKKVSSPTYDTTIYFSATHENNGDIVISCRDHGIGMDEHIIRNYFSIAGISYYRSTEFKRQRLGFEPISRFGIGVLSCFMVAENIEVKTYRDPDCGPAMAHADCQLPGADRYRARRLHLKIPAVERQFVVKDAPDGFDVGTEVKLKVLAKKVQQLNALKPEQEVKPNEPKDSFGRSLKVTEYLCELAGFVEFPIHVEERWPGLAEPKRTLILHPDRDPLAEREAYTDAPIVHQLSREYPWEHFAESECLGDVAALMKQRTFELCDLLRGRGYEGWVAFPVPKHEEWDFTNHAYTSGSITFGGRRQTYWWDRQAGQEVRSTLSWRHQGKYAELPSVVRRHLIGVYRDGILLDRIEAPEFPDLEALPLPLIRINLPPTEDLSPNVSRTSLRTGANAWASPVFMAIEEDLKANDVSAALQLPLEELFYRLGWLSVVYRIRSDALSRMVPNAHRPTVWLASPNRVIVRKLAAENRREAAILSAEAEGLAGRLVVEKWLNKPSAVNSLEWKGDAVFIWKVPGCPSLPLQMSFSVASTWANQAFVPIALRFLSPPVGIDEFLYDVVGAFVEEESSDVALVGDRGYSTNVRLRYLRRADVSEALTIARDRPTELQASHRHLLRDAFAMPGRIPVGPLVIPFTSPFANLAAVAEGHVNELHPFGRAFLRCMAAITLAERDEQNPQAMRRSLSDAQTKWQISAHVPNHEYAVREVAVELFKYVVERKLIPDFTPPPVPDDSDFVPKFREDREGQRRQLFWLALNPEQLQGAFGELVTQWPPLSRQRK